MDPIQVGSVEFVCCTDLNLYHAGVCYYVLFGDPRGRTFTTLTQAVHSRVMITGSETFARLHIIIPIFRADRVISCVLRMSQLRLLDGGRYI